MNAARSGPRRLVKLCEVAVELGASPTNSRGGVALKERRCGGHQQASRRIQSESHAQHPERPRAGGGGNEWAGGARRGRGSWAVSGSGRIEIRACRTSGPSWRPSWCTCLSRTDSRRRSTRGSSTLCLKRQNSHLLSRRSPPRRLSAWLSRFWVVTRPAWPFFGGHAPTRPRLARFQSACTCGPPPGISYEPASALLPHAWRTAGRCAVPSTALLVGQSAGGPLPLQRKPADAGLRQGHWFVARELPRTDCWRLEPVRVRKPHPSRR